MDFLCVPACAYEKERESERGENKKEPFVDLSRTSVYSIEFERLLKIDLIFSYYMMYGTTSIACQVTFDYNVIFLIHFYDLRSGISKMPQYSSK